MSKLYPGSLALVATFLLAVFGAVSPAFAQTVLYVNEIMASNNHTILDATGSSEDWFEIYNPNDVVVDLAGYYLSDKTSSPKKHKMPDGFAETRIPPHGYLVIWASEKPERGPLHVAFALSASGENVVITAPDGALVDVATFGGQNTDISYGRYPDGGSTWTFFSGATPGAANGAGTTQIPKLSAPAFSVPGGFKTAAFQLSITHPDPGVTIRYTTDGSEPSESDAPLVWKYKNTYTQGLDQGLLDATNQSYGYTGPIAVADRSSQPNRISMKSSTIEDSPRYFPEAPVYKGTVIRAKAFKTGALPSETVTSSYFISNLGGARFAMPVISLVSDERSFFDYTAGIYTAGRSYDRSKADPSLTNGNCGFVNYTMDGGEWERRGSFELFENGNPVFSQDNIGIRTHGFCSRRAPQKSLRIYSDTYFDYNFFPGQKAIPKRLMLRTRGNEVNSSEIKDLFSQKLVEFLPFDSQRAKPAIIFMNGEYYGFQSIRERFDRYYLENHYNVGNDDLDLIQLVLGKPVPNNYEVEEGDDLAYKSLMNLVHNSDMTDPANYETLKNTIDIDNYTDYQIAQVFIDNADWPFQNIRLWRTKAANQKAGAPYQQDGRWRFMFFDTDYAFYFGPTSASFNNATNGESTFAVLFRKLLQNQEYRRLFTSRAADLINTHFTADRAKSLLDQLKNTFEPLMPEFIDRWKEEPSLYSSWTAPQSMQEWNQAVTKIRDFVSARPVTFRDVLRNKLGSELTDVSLWIGVSDPALGYIRVNKIDILPTTPGVSQDPYPWTGTYFKTIPVQLTAVPKPDGFFEEWQGPDGFKSKNTTITLPSNVDALAYYAVFQKRPVLSDLVVNGTSITPGFVSTITDYNVTIPITTESVTVTPTYGDRANRANVNSNRSLYVPISNGATSAPLPMAPGVNKIGLQVYDFDGFGAKFYTVTVKRPMNTPGYAFNFAGSKLQPNANQIHYVEIDKRIETVNFTLEAWIRTSENSATGSEGYQASVLFNSDKSGNANDFTMGILNNKIVFYDGSVSKTTLGTTNVVDGRWHHVAVVREATVAVRIYVDGVLDIENTVGAGRATLNENSFITLGGNPTLAPASYQGSMDEARIWTTARTATELAQNMSTPVPANSPGLKAYYNFDIGVNDETTTVPDLTPNGNTATIGNMNTTTIGRSESFAMVVPAAMEATGITTTEFTANWTAPAVGTTERYLLDVSTSKTFASGGFLPGYEALPVNGTSKKVIFPAATSGRVAAMDYYYRVRADKSSVSGQGAFSATVRVVNPLPVTLVSFNGRKDEHGNLLEWKVTSETDFDHYEIERSYDARAFERIGLEKAIADGKADVTAYSFLDVNLLFKTSPTLYYRLKMVDRDGSFAFSRMVSITNELPGIEVGDIYPNPSDGKKMHVNITVNGPETWKMSAFSSAGMLLESSELALKKGANHIVLPFGNLTSGLYIVSFKNSTQQEVSRKVVIE